MKILKRINNKGESLVESLVSLFVLSLLVLAIVSIIQVSLRLSHRAVNSAEDMQQAFNPLLGDVFAGADERDIVFEFPINFTDTAGTVVTVSVTHTVRFENTQGILAFSPQ